MNSPKNQDYEEILQSGRNIYFGRFEILLDGINITDSCGIGLNGSSNRRSIVLYDGDGDALFDLDKKSNYFKLINCLGNNKVDHFIYYFKKKDFLIKEQITYFGTVVIRFTSKRINDPLGAIEDKAPWIESVEVDLDPKVLKYMESKYQLNSLGSMKFPNVR